MSSHDTSVRSHTCLQLHKGIQEADVVQAFLPFIRHHHRSCKSAYQSLADIEADMDSDSFITLGLNGELTFSITCQAVGWGEEPDGFQELETALSHLLDKGGVVQIVDHEISAANNEAVTDLYIAASGEGPVNHAVEIALANATQFLQDILKTDDLQAINMAIRAKAIPMQAA